MCDSSDFRLRTMQQTWVGSESRTSGRLLDTLLAARFPCSRSYVVTMRAREKAAMIQSSRIKVLSMIDFG